MNNSTSTTPYINTTLYNDPTLCTLRTCPLSWAQVHYDPSLIGNTLYLFIFSLILIIQLLLGIHSRTWSFLVAVCSGEILEIIGYVARIQMHNNPFLSDPFLMQVAFPSSVNALFIATADDNDQNRYLIVLTIAPCFLSAGIYLCFSRIVIVYGEYFARFRPRTYTIIFIAADLFSLVLQAVGGALADTAPSEESTQGQNGIDIMIAGLSFQVFSLFVFMGLCADFAGRARKNRADPSGVLRRCGCGVVRFYGFLVAITVAVLTIFARSCFRVAELQGGFNGKLANEEIPFMILEGAMIAIASIALTVWHPGLVFKAFWNLDRARGEMQGKKGNMEDSKDGARLMMSRGSR